MAFKNKRVISSGSFRKLLSCINMKRIDMFESPMLKSYDVDNRTYEFFILVPVSRNEITPNHFYKEDTSLSKTVASFYGLF